MSNRLADLDRAVRRQPTGGAARQRDLTAMRVADLAPGRRPSAPPATSIGDLARPESDDALSLGLATLRRRATGPDVRRGSRTLQLPVDHAVPGLVVPLRQPSPMGCWATVFAMLYSWREQQSMTIETALAAVGQPWVDLYKADTGLPGSRKAEFLAQAGLIAEPPMSYSVEGWEGLLRSYGPLWVTTDEAPGPAWAIHARVITAIKGDGSLEGTRFTIIDPATGSTAPETIATFLPKFEEEARDPALPLRIQVVHWPANALARSSSRIAAGASVPPPASSPQMALDVEVQRLRRAGVAEDDLQAFLTELGRGTALAASLSGPIVPDGTSVELPRVRLLEDWQASLIAAMLSASSLAAVVAAGRALTARLDVTVGVGPAAVAGIGAGVAGGFGIVFAPDGRMGHYGTIGAVSGWIASASASIEVTVIRGGPDRFAGTAIAKTLSIDLSEGPSISVSELNTPDGRFLGVAASVGLSVGVPVLSAIEAFVEMQQTRTSHSQGNGRHGSADAVLAYALEADIPLSPDAGGLSIGAAALEVGDVLLSTTDEVSSRLIRRFGGSEISHAAVYVGDGMVVEALADGVVLHSLEEALADDSVSVALRHPHLTPEQGLRIRDFVGNQIGRRYDKLAIVNHARFRIPAARCDRLSGEQRERCRTNAGRIYLGTATNDSFICSELVVAAFADAGVPLTTEPPHWASPEDLAQLRFKGDLEYVGHLKTR